MNFFAFGNLSSRIKSSFWRIHSVQHMVVFIFKVYFCTHTYLCKWLVQSWFSFKPKHFPLRSKNKPPPIMKLPAPFNTLYVFHTGRGVKWRQQLPWPYLSWGKTFTGASMVWLPASFFDVSNICCFGQKGIPWLVYMKN